MQCNLLKKNIIILGLLAILVPSEQFSFNFAFREDGGGTSASFRIEKSFNNRMNRKIKVLQGYDDTSNLISGGRYAADVGQFPFMAVVHRLIGNGRYSICGGSILSRRWVLTAGHCVAKYPRRFFVAFGVIDKTELGYDYVTGNGDGMIAIQGALHPGYHHVDNDIGLLYTPRDIPFSSTIRPIKLAGKSYLRTSFAESAGHIYGWGRDRTGGGAVKHLKYGRVPIITNRECSYSWDVDFRHICADTSSSDDQVCHGDSGGPLVVYSEDDEPMQIGIVSFGDSECPSEKPAVFTRVTPYLRWIQRVTGIHYI